MAGKVDKRKRDKFIKLLVEGRTVRSACRGARVSHGHMYDIRNAEEGETLFVKGFTQAWDDAVHEGTGVWEDSLFDLGVTGEPIISVNRKTGEAEIIGHKLNEKAVEFALRAKDPNTYAERRQITGADGGPIQTQKVKMTDDEKRERVKELRETLGKKDD